MSPRRSVPTHRSPQSDRPLPLNLRNANNVNDGRQKIKRMWPLVSRAFLVSFGRATPAVKTSTSLALRASIAAQKWSSPSKKFGAHRQFVNNSLRQTDEPLRSAPCVMPAMRNPARGILTGVLPGHSSRGSAALGSRGLFSPRLCRLGWNDGCRYQLLLRPRLPLRLDDQ